MGKVIGAMTPHPPWPAREACARYAHWNLGDPDSYPEMKIEMDKLLRKFSNIIFGRSYPGMLTSGASESNIIALYYWKLRGKRRVIGTPYTHYSVKKASKLLNMNYKYYNEDDIRSSDIIVVTIGTTEHGKIDPPLEIIEKARRVGAGVHVDAAYAGPIARYINDNYLPLLDDTVATMAVDLHKIPESPPPAGVFYAYDSEVLEMLKWSAPYIPSGQQFGLLGTRPGCVVKAASIALRITIEEYPSGISGLVRDLLRVRDTIVVSLEPYGFRSFGGPFPISCLHHRDIMKIKNVLNESGVSVYTCDGGRGIRIVAMPHHLWEGYEWIINEIQSAVSKATGGV